MTISAATDITVRRAERRDLDALVALERGFPGERISRASLARLLGRESAEVWVAEVAGAVVGDAVVLFRLGFATARLYSMVVNPQHRGQGVAKALLEAAETGARERGSVVIRLEVREDNVAAIALYQQAGYRPGGRSTDYYRDRSNALRMIKRFVRGGATVRGVPYEQQSFPFTSGPAALLMAMHHHGYPVPGDRLLELSLWREATTTFEFAGSGGCSAHGLGVAALRRGFQAVVVTPDSRVPFAAGLEPDALEVARAAHATFEREMRALGGRVEVRDFSHEDAAAAVERGAVALVLLSPTSDGSSGAEDGDAPGKGGPSEGSAGSQARADSPGGTHWVVVTGFDDEHVYLHDPQVPEYADLADSVHLAIRRELFDAACHRRDAPHHGMLLLERWGTVTHRPNGA